MPYAMCPICGSTMHLSVLDHAAWYKERHPDAPFGALVPEPCPYCFFDLAVGDTVITRKLINDNVAFDPDQRGEIRAIYTNAEFGNLYVVKLENGEELTCHRAAIRKPLGQEA